MSSDFNFTVTSWFLGNVRVKPYFNTQWGGDRFCPPCTTGTPKFFHLPASLGRNRMTCPILAAMWGGSLSLSILFFFQPVDTRLDTLLCCLTYMICMSVLVELEFDNLRFGCKICSYIGFFVVVLMVQTFFFSLQVKNFKKYKSWDSHSPALY